MSIAKYDTMDYMGVKGTVQMMKSMMQSDYLLDCKYIYYKYILLHDPTHIYIICLMMCETVLLHNIIYVVYVYIYIPTFII